MGWNGTEYKLMKLFLKHSVVVPYSIAPSDNYGMDTIISDIIHKWTEKYSRNV